MLDITRISPHEPYEIDDIIPIVHFDEHREPQRGIIQGLRSELDLRCGLRLKTTTFSEEAGGYRYMGNFYVVCDEILPVTTDLHRVHIIKHITQRWRYVSPYVRFHLTRYSFKEGLGEDGTKRVWLHFVLTSEPTHFSDAELGNIDNQGGR